MAELQWLLDNGFMSKEYTMLMELRDGGKLSREKFHDAVQKQRLVFKHGGRVWRVLKPNDDRPWWTVQKWTGNHCDYFVDFPIDVENFQMLRFMGLNLGEKKMT